MRPNIKKISFFPDIQYQSRPLTRQKFAFLLEVGFINRRRIWVSCQGRSWVCKIIDSRHLQEACCSWKKDGGNRRCITRGSICSFYSRIYEEWVRFYDTLCCVSVFFPVVKIRCLLFFKDLMHPKASSAYWGVLFWNPAKLLMKGEPGFTESYGHFFG